LDNENVFQIILMKYRAFCTVYYPDQQMHNIYLLLIFYLLYILVHVSVHVHHLQRVLTFCFAKVIKITTQ